MRRQAYLEKQSESEWIVVKLPMEEWQQEFQYKNKNRRPDVDDARKFKFIREYCENEYGIIFVP